MACTVTAVPSRCVNPSRVRVFDCAGPVPGTQHRLDGAEELRHWILREGVPGDGLVHVLQIPHDLLQRSDVEFCHGRDPESRRCIVEHRHEGGGGATADDLAVGLDEAAVGVPNEDRVAGARSRPGSVASPSPMLRMVSIMPGIETAAPDLTATRSGRRPAPKRSPVARSILRTPQRAKSETRRPSCPPASWYSRHTRVPSTNAGGTGRPASVMRMRLYALAPTSSILTSPTRVSPMTQTGCSYGGSGRPFTESPPDRGCGRGVRARSA